MPTDGVQRRHGTQALLLRRLPLLRGVYFGDLDFALLTPMRFEDILQGLAPIYEAIRDATGIEFAFDREDRQSHANSYTFYLKYEGPLPAGGSVKVDITIREELVFALEDRAVLCGDDEFED